MDDKSSIDEHLSEKQEATPKALVQVLRHKINFSVKLALCSRFCYSSVFGTKEL